MKNTICPYSLTDGKACRATVSIIAEEYLVVSMQPLSYYFYLTTQRYSLVCT